MKKIVFNSPYQTEVDASEYQLTFQNGEPREVEDDVADMLLRHPHFSEYGVEKAHTSDEQSVAASVAAPAPIAIDNAFHDNEDGGEEPHS